MGFIDAKDYGTPLWIPLAPIRNMLDIYVELARPTNEKLFISSYGSYVIPMILLILETANTTHAVRISKYLSEKFSINFQRINCMLIGDMPSFVPYGIRPPILSPKINPIITTSVIDKCEIAGDIINGILVYVLIDNLISLLRVLRNDIMPFIKYWWDSKIKDALNIKYTWKKLTAVKAIFKDFLNLETESKLWGSLSKIGIIKSPTGINELPTEKMSLVLSLAIMLRSIIMNLLKIFSPQDYVQKTQEIINLFYNELVTYTKTFHQTLNSIRDYMIDVMNALSLDLTWKGLIVAILGVLLSIIFTILK